MESAEEGLFLLLLSPVIVMVWALSGFLALLPVVEKGIREEYLRQEGEKAREREIELEKMRLEQRRKELEFRKLEARRPEVPVVPDGVLEALR